MAHRPRVGQDVGVTLQQLVPRERPMALQNHRAERVRKAISVLKEALEGAANFISRAERSSVFLNHCLQRLETSGDAIWHLQWAGNPAH
jgi:hypothetical protein